MLAAPLIGILMIIGFRDRTTLFPPGEKSKPHMMMLKLISSLIARVCFSAIFHCFPTFGNAERHQPACGDADLCEGRAIVGYSLDFPTRSV